MKLEAVQAFVQREIKAFVRDAVRPPQTVNPKPDETRLIERASEGSRARDFLESEAVQEFMARSEAQLIDRLTSLPLDNDAGRRDLAVAIQVQRQLLRYLGQLAQDGRSAERELERLSSGRREYF